MHSLYSRVSKVKIPSFSFALFHLRLQSTKHRVSNKKKPENNILYPLNIFTFLPFLSILILESYRFLSVVLRDVKNSFGKWVSLEARAGAGRRVIDFANTAAFRRKSHSVRKQHGREEKKELEGNCRFSVGETVHLPGKYPAKEEDRRRANSHDVDKVGRWAARWVSGGSTDVHQGGRRYVTSQEGGGVRRWNNDERGKERKPDELPRSLFSLLGDRSTASEGGKREKEGKRESEWEDQSDVAESRRKWARRTEGSKARHGDGDGEGTA